MIRLTEIDDLYRGEHHYLEAQDRCVFLRSYLSGKGYEAGETNQLILNFKIPPSCETDNPVRWSYKIKAIRKIADELRSCLNNSVFNGEWTLIPIPPSKCRSDPEYDDRLYQMLQYMCRHHPNADIRELIYQSESTPADHGSEMKRLRPEERVRLYRLDETLLEADVENIILFDDIITTGSHFKSAEMLLAERFPNAGITGIFVARAVREDEIDPVSFFDAV